MIFLSRFPAWKVQREVNLDTRGYLQSKKDWPLSLIVPTTTTTMRSLFFWAWTAFPTVVYCDNAIVEVEQAPRQPKCGIQGNRYLRPFLVTSQPSFSVEAQCGALCKSQQLCQSYSIEGSYCRLYSLPARYFELWVTFGFF